jgi:hypothetical protein
VAETIEELRNLPEDEIMRRHDSRARHILELPAEVDTQRYLDELARREAVEQSRRMEALTRSITRLILAVVGPARSVRPGLRDGDHVQGVVELTVPAQREPVAHHLAA